MDEVKSRKKATLNGIRMPYVSPTNPPRNKPMACPSMIHPCNWPNTAVRCMGSTTSPAMVLTTRMYPAGPPRMVISWVDWMIVMQAAPPAIMPTIWQQVRMAGISVCRNSANRGPHFLTVQPVMKRLMVPQKVVLMPKMENCVAVRAAIWLTAQRSPGPV